MALSAIDWYCLVDRSDSCLLDVVGNGCVVVSLVGRASSLVDTGVEALRVGVDICASLTFFSALFLSLPSSAVPIAVDLGVCDGVIEPLGEFALLFAADSRLCRAGNTLLAGVASDIPPAERSSQVTYCMLQERAHSVRESCSFR